MEIEKVSYYIDKAYKMKGNNNCKAYSCALINLIYDKGCNACNMGLQYCYAIGIIVRCLG